MKLGQSCTGCGACSLICPNNCIEMVEDRLGQKLPKIDSARCVQCGVCEACCPQMQPVAASAPIACYAVWSKLPQDWIYSASGGAGAVIARETFARGGFFFGCDYDGDGNLSHFVATSEEDLSKMQSSKYSHSDAYVCFREIKHHLQAKHLVVFVGTPCQVAGLLRYLRKRYETLITIDLVCHGTPPNRYLKQHIKERGLSFPITKIRFRGEFDKQLTVWKDGEIAYQKACNCDTYFSAFYENIISYDTCYSCQYAQANRVSDITLGDYWGLGELKIISAHSARPSLLLVNTQQGQLFFESMSDSFFFEKRPTEEGINGNGRLLFPPGKSVEATCFQKLYSTHLFCFHRTVSLAYRLSGVIKKVRKRRSIQ